MTAEVVEVDLAGDRAQNLRRILGRTVRNHIETQGDDLSGFALVTWDARGNTAVGYYTDTGPVGDSLMPAFVHDALNRAVAVVTAEETQSSRVDGD